MGSRDQQRQRDAQQARLQTARIVSFWQLVNIGDRIDLKIAIRVGSEINEGFFG